MHKDDKNHMEWCKHTRGNRSGNIVNKTNRRKVKEKIQKAKEEDLRTNRR